MGYILIADAGSTKSDWALVNQHDGTFARVTTPGFNASISHEGQISNILSELKQKLPINVKIDTIFYYGAGCASTSVSRLIGERLSNEFGNCTVEVESDMLGAAKSMLQHDSGVACILGTGSNSCQYNGTDIVKSVPSLGFILGDEGSGAALGKRLLANAFKGLLPPTISKKLIEKYNLDYSGVIENIYRRPSPNSYLASFVPFIHENIELVAMRELVYNEFESFVIRNLLSYEDVETTRVCFTGGIAHVFESILKEATEAHNIRINMIQCRPLEGLIKYHLSKL